MEEGIVFYFSASELLYLSVTKMLPLMWEAGLCYNTSIFIFDTLYHVDEVATVFGLYILRMYLTIAMVTIIICPWP